MPAPTLPVDRLNGLMAPIVSNDISGGLAAGATALEPVLLPDGTIVPLLGSIDSCLTQLAASLPAVTLSAKQNDQSSTKILEFMSKPFDELGTAIADLLLPDPDNVSGPTTQAVSDVGKQLAESISNPFYSVIASQTATLESSVNQIRKILFTGTDDKNGFIADYFDRARTTLKSLFLGDNTDGNFAAVYVFAIEHGIQAVDTELFLLRKMKKNLNALIEESSKLPSIIDFKLPNNGVVEKLCQAEVELKRTADMLRQSAKFDRGSFAKSSNLVCDATDLIYDGSFDTDLLKSHTKNFLGLAHYKDKDLANLKLLPNVEFKARLQELKTTAEVFKTQEYTVTELYYNMRNAAENIKSLADTQLGDILGILVDVLRRQIGSVRRELQVFGAGYDKTTADKRAADDIAKNSTDAKDIRSKTAERFKDHDPYKLQPNGIRIDVTTYASSQLASYLVLTNLCTLMRRVPLLYATIDRILTFQSATMRTILDLASRLDVSSCGNPKSGFQVLFAVQNFLAAADKRIRQDVSSNDTQLTETAKRLRQACDKRIEWLNCVKSHLFFGNEKMAQILSTINNGAALLNNLKDMASGYPFVKQGLTQLNFKNLLGLGETEYSPAGIMLKAIQCLLLNCDNPLLQDVGKDMVDLLEPEFKRERNKEFVMGSLDGIPNVAAKARSNRRIQQILRVLGAVQGILNLNTNQLCNSLNADKEREANVRRSAASRAVFDSVPVTSVRPSNVPGGNAGPTRAVKELGDALVYESILFPAEEKPSATPFGNPDTAFSTGQ
jgi:hypothetical protein